MHVMLALFVIIIIITIIITIIIFGWRVCGIINRLSVSLLFLHAIFLCLRSSCFQVRTLSGGELQRVAIVLCLGKPANIYLSMQYKNERKRKEGKGRRTQEILCWTRIWKKAREGKNGEPQCVVIVLCLGKPANIYLTMLDDSQRMGEIADEMKAKEGEQWEKERERMWKAFISPVFSSPCFDISSSFFPLFVDEPSAYLDCKQRLIAAKVIKRFICSPRKLLLWLNTISLSLLSSTRMLVPLLFVLFLVSPSLFVISWWAFCLFGLRAEIDCSKSDQEIYFARQEDRLCGWTWFHYGDLFGRSCHRLFGQSRDRLYCTQASSLNADENDEWWWWLLLSALLSFMICLFADDRVMSVPFCLLCPCFCSFRPFFVCPCSLFAALSHCSPAWTVSFTIFLWHSVATPPTSDRESTNTTHSSTGSRRSVIMSWFSFSLVRFVFLSLHLPVFRSVAFSLRLVFSLSLPLRSLPGKLQLLLPRCWRLRGLALPNLFVFVAAAPSNWSGMFVLLNIMCRRRTHNPLRSQSRPISLILLVSRLVAKRTGMRTASYAASLSDWWILCYWRHFVFPSPPPHHIILDPPPQFDDWLAGWFDW